MLKDFYLNYFIFALALFVINFSGCASYKTQLWQSSEETPVERPNEQAVHSVYAIGNLGQSKPDALIWKTFNSKIKGANPNSSVLFLGNQVSNGMPKEEAGSVIAEEELDRIIEMLDGFEGQVHFIPGNTDWGKSGRKGLKAQKKYLEKALNREDIFFPEPGCGDPQQVTLSTDVNLLLLDSQWWLEDWIGQPKINSGCEIKSRGDFQPFFEDLLKKNRNKSVLIASHHPLFSNGYYGGQYRMKEHLFPLSFLQKDLYVPLPILGSVISTIRASVAGPQELAHPSYKGLKADMLNTARKNGHFNFIAAHENNQQYIESDDQSFILSGAGEPVHAARLGNGTQFKSGRAGYSKIDFYQDGSSWVAFFDESGTLLYTHQLNGAREKEEIPESVMIQTEPIPATTSTILSKDDFTRTKFGNFLWGRHYREAYNAQLEVASLNLDEFQPNIEGAASFGLRPIKRGGGYQTNSLRLENKESGQQFTMRSVDKDPLRTIPYPFNQSFILDVVKDNFSSSHPIGALAVPPLADAVGVYHTNPKLYYVPPQIGLEIYNDQFSKALYLLEERPDDEVWSAAKSFGYPEDIVSTSKAIENLTEKHDHVIAYSHVVRSRLFDMMIGDWDRHDDQWRWAIKKEEGLKVYRPIPRDRDQAFSNYDGFLISFMRELTPIARRWRPFRGNMRRVYWTTFGSRYFDATFLDGAPWEVWQSEIAHIQENVTDQVIEAAFADTWPESIYSLDAPTIIKNLKKRRDRLDEYGRRFYLNAARKIDVIGTEERDYFLIERALNGAVTIKVWGYKEGEKSNLYYNRTFSGEETKEIVLYGLGKKDHFEFRGVASDGPTVRVIGGLGEDNYEDEISKAGVKKNIIYDNKGKDLNYKKGQSTRLKLTDDPIVTAYNRKSRDYDFDFLSITPLILANPDDGLSLGLTTQFKSYGFRKAPYASSHKLGLRYALATSGWSLNYRGEFIDLVQKTDLLWDVNIQTPLYTGNFYGFGNETPNFEERLGKDYNRLRLRSVESFLGLMRKKRQNYFAIGPVFQSVRAELTPGRFIEEVGANFDPETYDGLEYLGAKAVYHFKNTDNLGFPTYGIQFDAEIAYLEQIDDSTIEYPYFKGAFRLYRHLDANKNLVFATRIGGQYTFNNEFTIFQGAVLGGIGRESNFRGFRRDRYRGKASFYQNTDLRWVISSSQNQTLPFSMGILSGFDYGRVWLDGEDSNVWHYSFGGGLFISPFDQISINLSVFRSDNEITRFVFGGGFFF